MHTQISLYMANNVLPEQYRKWPLNFLYAFFLTYIEVLKNQYGETVNNVKSGGENKYLFDAGENDIVITFKEKEKTFSVIIFESRDEFPNFEENFGFSQDFTKENLVIISVDTNKSDEVRMRIGGGVDEEKTYSLDAFNQGDQTFPGGGAYAQFFHACYMHVMEKEFAHLADA